ncbi:MAG: hypothetical protein K1X89_27570 [Myxococcaceae bacterium]|nr:hypothetical protein [Myxococcaceae bacterium]
MSVSWLVLLALSPRWALTVERDAAAQSCPDGAALQRLVAERLGQDPFGEPGPHRAMAVRVRASGERLTATLELFDEAGARLGLRELSGSPDCRELSSAVATTAAIAIDPMVLMRPAPASTDAGPPALPVLEPAPQDAGPQDAGVPALPAAPEPSAPAPWSGVVVEGGAGFSAGHTPAPTGAVLGRLTWQSEHLAFGGALVVTGPGVVSLAPAVTGSLAAFGWELGPVGCARLSRFGLCGGVRMGALTAFGAGFSGARAGVSSPALSLTLSPYVEFGLTERFALRWHISLEGRPLRTVYAVAGRDVFASSGVAFFTALSLAARASGAAVP